MICSAKAKQIPVVTTSARKALKRRFRSSSRCCRSGAEVSICALALRWARLKAPRYADQFRFGLAVDFVSVLTGDLALLLGRFFFLLFAFFCAGKPAAET